MSATFESAPAGRTRLNGSGWAKRALSCEQCLSRSRHIVLDVAYPRDLVLSLPCFDAETAVRSLT